MHDPTRYTVFDIETTGLYPQQGARIIEIAAVAVREGAIVGEFSSLSNFYIKFDVESQWNL